MVLPEDNDAGAVRLAQDGRKEGLEALYRKYIDALYRFFYWQTNKSDDAEDLTQDTFVEAGKSLHTFQGKSSFRSWLYAIARRQLAHWLAQKYQKPQASFPDYLGETADDWIEPDDDEGEKKQSIIRQLLTHVSVGERRVIVLRFLKSATVAECAEKLGLSSTNVKVITHRALEKIKKAVAYM